MAERRFLTIWVTTALAIAALVIAFNVLVDPYRMLQWTTVPGVNERRPEIYSHLRITKTYGVRWLEPHGLILGSSRVEAGIDPQNPTWNSAPVYNLGLAGANIYETFRYLQHAHAITPISQAVLGLDFGMFVRFRRPDFDESRLAVDAAGRANAFPIVDVARNVLSIDATASSFVTVMSQHRPELRDYRTDGMRKLEPEWIRLRNLGHRSAFLDVMRLPVDPVDASAYETFAKLLAFCRAQRIDLRIFISPSHAWDMERIRLNGAWTYQEEWKRRLVATLEAEPARDRGQTPFPLWDFSGYNDVTTETVPQLDDKRSRMKWYWEASHYTNVTGDAVLAVVLGKAERGSVPVGGFGTLLTSANIDEHLRITRRDGAEYRSRNPTDIAEIEAQVGRKRKPDELSALN
jgi:hypothetical protein